LPCFIVGLFECVAIENRISRKPNRMGEIRALGEETGDRIGPQPSLPKAAGGNQALIPTVWKAERAGSRACAPSGLVARIGPPVGAFSADSRIRGMLP
jgi:hypothetical protein